MQAVEKTGKTSVTASTRGAALGSAAFAGACVLGATLLAGRAHAQETGDDKQPKRSLTARQYGGAYEKAKTPLLGLGFSGRLDYGWVKLDTTTDAYFPKFEAAGLDHAEIDITFPAGPVAFMPFAYRSQYFGGVPFAAGMGFHMPKLNLHACPHWIQGSNALPVPIAWTPSVGKLNLLFKVVPVSNHFALTRPAPLIGGEAMASYLIADGVHLYAKAFEMTARNTSGRAVLGVFSTQAGVTWDL